MKSFGSKPMLGNVLRWTRKRMWPNKGFFIQNDRQSSFLKTGTESSRDAWTHLSLISWKQPEETVSSNRTHSPTTCLTAYKGNLNLNNRLLISGGCGVKKKGRGLMGGIEDEREMVQNNCTNNFVRLGRPHFFANWVRSDTIALRGFLSSYDGYKCKDDLPDNTCDTSEGAETFGRLHHWFWRLQQ